MSPTDTPLSQVSNPFGMALASVISPLIAVESTDVALSVCIGPDFLHWLGLTSLWPLISAARDGLCQPPPLRLLCRSFNAAHSADLRGLPPSFFFL